MQDAILFGVPLPYGGQSCIQSHFSSHEAGQLFKEPQIGFLGLRAVPLIGAGQVKTVFCCASSKSKLLLSILAEPITIAFSGKDQRLPVIGPMIEIFVQYSGLIKGETIGILDAVVEVDDLKTGRFWILIS